MGTRSRVCNIRSATFPALALLLLGGLYAGSVALAGDAISVILGGSSLSVNAAVADVRSIRLSVAGPGDFFAEAQTDGAQLDWSAPSGMVDGEYRYEVFAATGGRSREIEDSRLYREQGRFDVQGGVFVAPRDPLPPGAANATGQEQSLLERLALRAIERLIPAASAADLIASDGDPTVFFDDTDTMGMDWAAYGDTSYFGIFDYMGTARWALFFNQGATTTAINQHNDNNLSLAGDKVYIDYARDFGGVSGPAVGIGTTTPIEALDIVHPFPAIRISDGATGVWLLEEIFDDFRIKSETDNQDRLTIQAVTGNVGINNQNPEDTLDVGGKVRAGFSGANLLGDGMTKVFRMNANNTEPSKSSDVGFELSNARVGFSWAFRTFEGPQGFAATKQGSGGSELTIENPTTDYRNVVLRLGSGATNTNGQWINASSRAYKDNIQDLSAADAIQALEALNPVTYTFRNDPGKDLNVGFIAEDTPELISTPDRKGLNPLEVVAMLARVVKEQQRVLEGQQQLLDTLLRERDARQQAEHIAASGLDP